MPLLNHPKRIKKLWKEYQSKKVAIPCFCAENTFTIEGILRGTFNFAQKHKLDSIPVYIAATGNYYGRQQLANYTSQNSTKEGFLAFRSDLERLARNNGPFPIVEVIPSLDHGQPTKDDYLFEQCREFWGCVMFDCSKYPMKKNVKMTAEFVKKHNSDYIIEGCVNEIVESGDTDQMQLTDPHQAKVFLDETNVDLMVVNLGTEHRATKSQLKYRGDIAREISFLVGNKLVLHGTSSLTENDLPKLALDGIFKINIWTILETQTAKKLIYSLMHNIAGILDKEEIEALVKEERLGNETASQTNRISTQLHFMTELYRRNEIKVPTVSDIVESYYEIFFANI